MDVNKLNILIAENMWGEMSKEQAIEHQKGRIFYCGHCSEDLGTNIYHNVIGRHKHFDLLDDDFQQIIKNKIIELNK